MDAPVTIYEYGPNFSGLGRLHTYNGRETTFTGSTINDEPSTRTYGYLVPFLDHSLQRRKAVLFGDGEKVFIDLEKGATEILPSGRFVVNGIFWRKLRIDTPHGFLSFWVFTPPTRYLGNDGQYPEDVEPIVHLLQTFSSATDRHRFVTYFATGKWPEQ